MMSRMLLSGILIALSYLPSCFARAANVSVDQTARSVTIYRDAYGVPHVYGPTDASVVFGFVYAQAEDNFPQVEENYIRALGRASEFYGPDTVGTEGGTSFAMICS